MNPNLVEPKGLPSPPVPSPKERVATQGSPLGQLYFYLIKLKIKMERVVLRDSTLRVPLGSSLL